MLTDKEIDALLDVFQRQMQGITDEYLQKMGEHIARIGTLYPSDVNRLIEMKRVNKNMSDIQRKLARYSGSSLSDIAKIFAAVAQSDARFMEGYFHKKASAATMRRVIEAQLRVTQGAMKNISQTTLESQAYRRTVDAAIQAVQSGVSDYRSAVRRALGNAASTGLKVVYPSGRKMRMDSAVRMNVLDGVRAVNQQILYSLGDDFGADGVEISAHMMCAEDHLPYQGRQYNADTFRGIQTSLPRPFGMWNCRHTMYPIILGISEPAYSEDELRYYTKYSTEPIEIDGKTKTRYEWSQEMRRTETAIRASKDKETALLWNNDRTGADQCRAEQEQLKDYYMGISEKAGLDLQWNRTGTGKSAREYLGGEEPTFGKVDQRKVQRQREPEFGLTAAPKSGIIDIEIDELTPCLRKTSTGELVDTSVSRVQLTKAMTKGWEFKDWTRPQRSGYEVYALKASGDKRIQGLISLKKEPENYAVYIDIVESAPHNNTHNPLNKDGVQEYSGVGGHLFAEACRQSVEAGYGGFVYFKSKTNLIEYYQKELGAQLIDPSARTMAINELAARKLIARYFGGK